MLSPLTSSLSSIFIPESYNKSYASFNTPLYNVERSGDSLIITYEVPGYDKSELDLKFDPTSGTLTLSGSKEIRPPRSYVVEKIPPRPEFTKIIAVGAAYKVDSATHLNGWLTVVLKGTGGEPPGQSIMIS